MNPPTVAADRLPFVLPKHWTRVQLFEAYETHVLGEDGAWAHDPGRSTDGLQVQLDRWQNETRHLVTAVSAPSVMMRDVIPGQEIMYIRSISVVYVPAVEANNDPRKPVPGVGYVAPRPPAGLRGRSRAGDDQPAQASTAAAST